MLLPRLIGRLPLLLRPCLLLLLLCRLLLPRLLLLLLLLLLLSNLPCGMLLGVDVVLMHSLKVHVHPMHLLVVVRCYAHQVLRPPRVNAHPLLRLHTRIVAGT